MCLLPILRWYFNQYQWYTYHGTIPWYVRSTRVLVLQYSTCMCTSIVKLIINQIPPSYASSPDRWSYEHHHHLLLGMADQWSYEHHHHLVWQTNGRMSIITTWNASMADQWSYEHHHHLVWQTNGRTTMSMVPRVSPLQPTIDYQWY